MNPAAVAWLRAHWRGLTLAALLAVLAGGWTLSASDARHWRLTAENAEARRIAQEAATRAATETARRLDAARAARVQAEQAAIAERNRNALETELEDARARTADYARRMRIATAAADPRRGGTAPVPAAADAARPAGAPADGAVVARADLDRCTDAYVVAAGWQRWWAEVSRVER